MSGIVELQRLAETRVADGVWSLCRDEIVDTLGRKQRTTFPKRVEPTAFDTWETRKQRR